ncbi:VOC family protein [Rhodococcus rhodnii]|uniref:Glyoxalase-like domain-containing protein n=2 Tax=Rhodococcus rhodnii TaxID=38312 RepID=R7WNC6_9NOCA|nr:VOC family protein [Rhodococcus rhodnii]EOM76797.1 hypothetical protein Rrhod_1917 [Rhodococcus rhodnii LMG 5362]TXG90029.1 VOC family protein [Rhodococcus rhodnii]
MPMTWTQLVVNSLDPEALGRWWAQALGWEYEIDQDGDVVVHAPGSAPDLLFLKVPEVKSVFNRLHLDFRPDDQKAEVARLLELGARTADVGQGEDVPWVVLADPEGNEFCVLSGRS